MLFILMAMQSQAPGSAMSSNTMLPLLLMDSESDNSELIMFMAMMNNQNCDSVEIQQPETETIYRTWKLNADGTRTLVSENEA